MLAPALVSAPALDNEKFPRLLAGVVIVGPAASPKFVDTVLCS